MVEGFIKALLVGLLLVIFGFALHHFHGSLKQPVSRKTLSERLFHPGYFGLLEDGLDWLERVFGPGMRNHPFRLGLKGFGVCLFLSLCYALASFTVGWMLGGPGTLGEAPMFKDTGFLAEWWPRPVRGVVFLLIPVVVFLVIRWTDRKTSAWVARRTGTGQRPLQLRSNIVMAGAFAGAGAFAVAGAGAVVVAGAVAVAFAFAVAGAVACAVVLGVAFANEFAVTILLFYFLLPLFNAFWDWGSLSLSRWLGREILERRSAVAMLGLGLVDLIAAVGFLVSLAVVLPFFAGLLERSTSTSLELGRYLDMAAADPWTVGFWATFMLFSTLLPTAAHVAFVLFGVLPCAGRKSWSWRERLKQQINSDVDADHLWPALYFSFWWVVSGGLVVLAVWGLSWLLITGHIPVAAHLLDIARWSLAMSGASPP